MRDIHDTAPLPTKFVNSTHQAPAGAIATQDDPASTATYGRAQRNPNSIPGFIVEAGEISESLRRECKAETRVSRKSVCEIPVKLGDKRGGGNYGSPPVIPQQN